MIVFRCLCCSLENLSIDVLVCPRCGGIKFVAGFSTPEKNGQLTEKTINFSDQHTTPTTEAKLDETFSTASLGAQNESSAMGFTFSSDDTAYGCKGSEVKCLWTEEAVAYNLITQNVSLEQELPPPNLGQDILVQRGLLLEMQNTCGNEDGKMDFEGSSDFLTQKSMLHSYPDDLIHENKVRDTQNKGNISNSDLLSEIGNISTRSSLSKYMERVYEASHSEAHSSIQQERMEGLENTNAMLKKRSSAPKSKVVCVRCGKCGRKFGSQSALNVHVQNNCHPRPYKCDHCDARFSYPSYKIRHQPMHFEEKPFQCDQCTYACKWKHDLNKHIKRFHRVP